MTHDLDAQMQKAIKEGREIAAALRTLQEKMREYMRELKKPRGEL